MSEIKVNRVCSNGFTQFYQTNFFLADKGVDLVFTNSKGLKKVIPAGELSSTLLSDVLSEGKLKVDFVALGFEDDEYSLTLCDTTFADCKNDEPVVDSTTADMLKRYPGMKAYSLPKGSMGLISGLRITGGIGTAKFSSVLLNYNKAQASRFNGGSIFASVNKQTRKKYRLNNNVSRPDVIQSIPTSSNSNSDDFEECDQRASPLVLDFGSDGVFGGQPKTVSFDINADGHADQLMDTLDSNDFLLVMDRNRNGKIDNAAELFGNYTGSAKGVDLYKNGFQALATLDSNSDGVVDAKDSQFKSLSLWKMGAHTMLPLSSKDVISISVAYKKVAKADIVSGNSVLQTGLFTTRSGKVLPIVDLWYQINSDGTPLRQAGSPLLKKKGV
jgi:hypothetical protein